MLTTALFSDDNLLLSEFATQQVIKIVNRFLANYHVDFLNMGEEDIRTLASHEMKVRSQNPDKAFLVPLSVSSRSETVHFWLLNAFLELTRILSDEAILRPSLRCEYLIVRILHGYISNIYDEFEGNNVNEESFRIELPFDYDVIFDDYMTEMDGFRFHDEFEGMPDIAEIKAQIKNDLTDIRCWVGYEKTHKCYVELLLETLLACGGLLRIEEKSAGNQRIHLLRPAYIAGNEILCDYSVFDRCASPGALIDEKSLLVPDVNFDGVCWEKVLAAAQVLIYGVSDVNDSNALTKGWINFALGRNVFPEAEPVQTERYFRTQSKTHGEAIRSRVWLTLKATKAHVSMNDVQAALCSNVDMYCVYLF